MKANELMIGDLVKHSVTSEVIRVSEFTLNEELDFQRYYVNGNLVENVEPIPLTREILQKNGFCKDDDVVWAAHCPEDKNFDLEISEPNYYDEGNPNGIIAWTINSCEYCILQFKYVHELQHALHLCGIEKEIVL